MSFQYHLRNTINFAITSNAIEVLATRPRTVDADVIEMLKALASRLLPVSELLDVHLAHYSPAFKNTCPSTWLGIVNNKQPWSNLIFQFRVLLKLLSVDQNRPVQGITTKNNSSSLRLFFSIPFCLLWFYLQQKHSLILWRSKKGLNVMLNFLLLLLQYKVPVVTWHQ